MILGTAGLCIFLAQRKHENEAKVEHGQRSAQRKKRSCDGKECAAACCNSTFCKKNGKHISKFPLKNPERNRWCNLIKRQHGRDGFTVNNETVIYDQHFRPEDIHRSVGGTRKRLHRGKFIVVCTILYL